MWFTVQWPKRLLISTIEMSHGVIFNLFWRIPLLYSRLNFEGFHHKLILMLCCMQKNPQYQYISTKSLHESQLIARDEPVKLPSTKSAHKSSTASPTAARVNWVPLLSENHFTQGNEFPLSVDVFAVIKGSAVPIKRSEHTHGERFA